MVEGPLRAPNVTLKRARKLRREMTLPEAMLWQALRKGRLAGLRFRRQHPIGPYILDFYCAEARLAVEVDGLAHDTEGQARRDERREAWLAERGIRVLRFRAGDVLKDERLEDVLAAIQRAAAPSTAFGGPPRLAGEEPPDGAGRLLASCWRMGDMSGGRAGVVEPSRAGD